MKARRLGRFGEAGALLQPPLFENSIPRSVSACGADVEADIRTFKGKYAAAYESFRGLTQEIRKACEKKKPLITILNGLVKLLANEASPQTDEMYFSNA